MNATHAWRFSHPADYCRARGWVVGDRLTGREGATVTTIELRYVGEEIVVAKTIRENGKAVELRETSWSLNCREWRRTHRASCAE